MRLFGQLVAFALLLWLAGCGGSAGRSSGAARTIKGHRFEVVADVDGDGAKDTLIERYEDPATGLEVDKYIEGAPYDSLAARVWRLQPRCFVQCSGHAVRPLEIRYGGSFGLAHLGALGDLNGDSREEIGWVGDWADHSNVNTYHVCSWNGSAWKELASFGMWEWQLPELPGADREFGLFGQTGRGVTGARGEAEFVRLVWPMRGDSVKVLGMTDEADLDTLMMPLRPLGR